MTRSLNPNIAVGAETLLYTSVESLDPFLADARFMPHYLARTTLSSTYYGEHPAAGRIVLKRLHEHPRVNRRAVVQNVHDKQTHLPKELFASVHHTLPEAGAYVLGFLDGMNGKDVLEQKPEPSPEVCAQLILGYAAGLNHLHTRGFLYGDNKWSNVMVTPQGVRFIDLDSIGTEAEHNDPSFCGFFMSSRPFQSREQELLRRAETTDISSIRKTSASERESFARLIERIYVKEAGYNFPIDPTDSDPYYIAKRNKQKYSKERAEKFPPHLRQVIVPLLTYPRKDSITLDNIVTAVKLDYQM